MQRFARRIRDNCLKLSIDLCESLKWLNFSIEASGTVFAAARPIHVIGVQCEAGDYFELYIWLISRQKPSEAYIYICMYIYIHTDIYV